MRNGGEKMSGKIKRKTNDKRKIKE